jgi:hypothetical protein
MGGFNLKNLHGFSCFVKNLHGFSRSVKNLHGFSEKTFRGSKYMYSFIGITSQIVPCATKMGEIRTLGFSQIPKSSCQQKPGGIWCQKM